MASETLPVIPGHSLGALSRSTSTTAANPLPNHASDLYLALSSSLYEVLLTLQEDKERYHNIQLHFSQSTPLTTPVVVTLALNGIRLRFDGPDQRLRLIEVLDFQKVRLTYKGSELIKNREVASSASFKRIYQLFGASYPGEYLPPKSGHTGTYVLSWPGIAFNFPLQNMAGLADKDHVSLLGSNAASPATQMAIFEGKSWPEVRNQLFVKSPSGPRSSAVANFPRDALAPEIEEALITESGTLTLIRRTPAPPFNIILGQTTPQDLLTELGSPDATHNRDTQAIADQLNHPRAGSFSRPTSNGKRHVTPPSSYSSTGTDTFETEFDSGDAEDDSAERAGRERFWCYFTHGMDILVGPPSQPNSSEDPQSQHRTPISASPRLVVLKIVIHGNVPGSYAFNRHRRLHWSIDVPAASSILNSEHHFEDIQADLMQAFAHVWPESEMGRGKVVNRTWGGSPTDSSFFLPDADHDLVEGVGSEQWLGNTKLYAFPGLTFEVLSNGAICALTVS